MFGVLFRLAGIDLDQRIVQMKRHLDDLAARTTDQVKREVREAGITAALAIAGLIALMGAAVIGLIGLYWWIELQNGRFVALATIGGVVAVVALLLLTIAAARGKSRPAPLVTAGTTSDEPVQPANRVAAVEPSPLPSLNLTSVIPPPASSSLMDQLTHRVTMQAAGVSDEALAAATNVMAKGSRGAVIGLIALVAITGVAVGRYRR